MILQVSYLRVWLFRGLVIGAAILMLVSFVMPWWIAVTIYPMLSEKEIPANSITVYAYGLRHTLYGYDEIYPYIEEDETPFYQMVLAWIYLIISVGLIISCGWLKGRYRSLLLGGVGAIYIAYAAIAGFVVISNRLAELGLPLQGWGVFRFAEADILGRLGLGYYLAYCAGFICLAISLLGDKIEGKVEADKK